MDIVTATLASIKPVDSGLLQQAQTKLDNKTKPPGSLGRLEEFARRMSAISGNLQPDTGKKCI
ncbi:MAG: nicotinate-nucleotide--dimethylbenzimidazole phosphoribosyltransferase, partial [Deltaproteobacteria bacterium]